MRNFFTCELQPDRTRFLVLQLIEIYVANACSSHLFPPLCFFISLGLSTSGQQHWVRKVCVTNHTKCQTTDLKHSRFEMIWWLNGPDVMWRSHMSSPINSVSGPKQSLLQKSTGHSTIVKIPNRRQGQLMRQFSTFKESDESQFTQVGKKCNLKIIHLKSRN